MKVSCLLVKFIFKCEGHFKTKVFENWFLEDITLNVSRVKYIRMWLGISHAGQTVMLGLLCVSACVCLEGNELDNQFCLVYAACAETTDFSFIYMGNFKIREKSHYSFEVVRLLKHKTISFKFEY